MGGVLHTLNLRLHPEELAYIVNHADDRVVLVDESLLPLWEQVRPRVKVPVDDRRSARPSRWPTAHLEYEALHRRGPSRAQDLADPDERAAAAMCYTTGTTGNPKGVLYSHRALVLHTLGLSLDHCMGIARARRRAAGGADVPRQRLGHAVRGGDGRREAGDAGAASRSREPRRSVSAPSASR